MRRWLSRTRREDGAALVETAFVLPIMLLVCIGMLIAIPGVYAAGRLIRGLLVDISPWDPFTLSAVAFGLLLVTMAACYVPARRVLRIDPAPLLRQA